MRIQPLALSLTLALALSACSSTPKKPDAAAIAPVAAPAAAPAPAPAVPVQADPLAALTDPNSILSKRSVYFDFDRYEIKPDYQALVEAHGHFLASQQQLKVLVQGNADERGSREYNLALGQKRAEATKQGMMLQGAKEAQIEAVSLGKEHPRAKGNDEAAWAENRRSDILYPGEH